METILAEFAEAYAKHAGYQLADTMCPETSIDMLREIWGGFSALHDPKSAIKKRIQLSTRDSWGGMSGEEAAAWADVYLGYFKTLGELLAVQDASAANGKSSWKKVYGAWSAMLSSLMRGYDKGVEAWTLPCLYMAGKHLRAFAIKADEERNSSNGTDASNAGQAFQDDFNPEEEQHQTLEECARTLNRVFTMCISDRAPLEESRKWGIYHIANLLFKTYFRLNSASLSKNIFRILSAGRGDMPELSSFPKSQQVTFKYYDGVLLFLEENYVEAEQRFTDAWQLCHKDATKNKELILTYLIPCHLLTTHTLPSDRLLEPYPRLQRLFIPLSRCIRKGDLHGFDQALQDGEDEFVKRRIYLTLERGRDIALRNLLRKVFVAGGFEEPKDAGAPPVRRTRIPIAEFAAAISIGSKETLDSDEVECLLANMIYKNLMKGYIAREAGKVVLSKTGAFPGTTL